MKIGDKRLMLVKLIDAVVKGQITIEYAQKLLRDPTLVSTFILMYDDIMRAAEHDKQMHLALARRDYIRAYKEFNETHTEYLKMMRHLDDVAISAAYSHWEINASDYEIAMAEEHGARFRIEYQSFYQDIDEKIPIIGAKAYMIDNQTNQEFDGYYVNYEVSSDEYNAYMQEMQINQDYVKKRDEIIRDIDGYILFGLILNIL